jgi:hypothetical protein
MRDVRDQLDLAQLQAAKQGFILNARTPKRLHRAWCESVGAMMVGGMGYRKIFFDDLSEARNWLDKEYTASGWEVCGVCRPCIK